MIDVIWIAGAVLVPVAVIGGLVLARYNEAKRVDFDPDRMPAPRGSAPGWRIRCLTCGRTRPAGKAGVTRVAAYGTTRTLGICLGCRRPRWATIERVRS